MALAKDKARAFQLGSLEEYPVAAGAIIFEGAAVGEDGSGYARPLQAGDVFLGFNEETVDNTGGSAGDERARVKTRGRVELAIAGLAITANDRPAVYASDDDTFTLTATGNSQIGYVSRFDATGVGIVEFDAANVRTA